MIHVKWTEFSTRLLEFTSTGARHLPKMLLRIPKNHRRPFLQNPLVHCWSFVQILPFFLPSLSSSEVGAMVGDSVGKDVGEKVGVSVGGSVETDSVFSTL